MVTGDELYGILKYFHKIWLVKLNVASYDNCITKMFENPLKAPENHSFCDVFKGYRERSLA